MQEIEPMNETMETPAENIVRLENVSFTSDGFEILRDVTLNLEAGRSTVIMGHSGSGKSTLLKIAAGLLLPSAGRVLIRDRDVSRMTSRELLVHRKDRGFVFQDAALWANTSIYRNLALPLEVHHIRFTESEIDARVKRTADRFGILDELELRPAQLSMGEQKIVSFLRALITEPSVLFLDEPTTSVDHASAEKMIAMIREFKADGGSIVAVTHDAKLASLIADNLVLVKDGWILTDGPFAKVIRSRDRDAVAILSEVLSQASTYDLDILELLSHDEDNEG